MSATTVADSMSRTPSDYTANNNVREIIHNNPIPSEMIGKCIEEGFLQRQSSKNQMNVTLRYEEGSEHIELVINLQGSKVFDLDSSYIREEPTIIE